MTNYEYFQSLTEKQLAKYLVKNDIADASFCKAERKECLNADLIRKELDKLCEECALKWLKEKKEEGALLTRTTKKY